MYEQNAIEVFLLHHFTLRSSASLQINILAQQKNERLKAPPLFLESKARTVNEANGRERQRNSESDGSEERDRANGNFTLKHQMVLQNVEPL